MFWVFVLSGLNRTAIKIAATKEYAGRKGIEKDEME
jgi:hypothetical protein